MDKFYKEVETWFQEVMKDAPEQLRSGFFVSYLEFYDLQSSLLEGTLVAALVAMLVSFAVLALATRSILLRHRININDVVSRVATMRERVYQLFWNLMGDRC